ncbi:hypothetical protein GUITHDRAFT_75303 [Guillardia theta CCMP2712]|uniref:Uncharacterized protein n=1 Tax=Guillardia theta (strain CCMP2712) TaxID=905079 RepID=L1IWP1_GUITC|nr:hypothetical protein GUITHDRAFT_75303 [Guillardia theta CCMP2712]EKX40688.1 hypothetical protein GUITHDRAFT_75303 [Guillardia theta CCMP2712]|mmetsp:Transcript_23880/g.77703  ORF Transcript_23880/g.77703 Transcript_23880/m.77703 type:complete len:179 (-) Transcript_23880:122-658(-)|eukprot:XP_005827668.1 hypothetical protein GUITHDRAFT_75303 [Guillardia theta CCMP2712]
MGVLFSKLWERLFSSGSYKIIIIGLDNAGKTTTLYRLNLGDVVVTQPTIGSNVEEVVHNNIRFECWDLGGQESLRPSWGSYYVNAHAIILVVDSTDRDRISSVRDELRNLLTHEDLKKAVILILANKQDLRDAMTAVEISDSLLLHSIRSHEWHIQAACALTGEGHREGLDWIASKLK